MTLFRLASTYSLLQIHPISHLSPTDIPYDRVNKPPVQSHHISRPGRTRHIKRTRAGTAQPGRIYKRRQPILCGRPSQSGRCGHISHARRAERRRSLVFFCWTYLSVIVAGSSHSPCLVFFFCWTLMNTFVEFRIFRCYAYILYTTQLQCIWSLIRALQGHYTYRVLEMYMCSRWHIYQPGRPIYTISCGLILD
jgi:hypothetical protein